MRKFLISAAVGAAAAAGLVLFVKSERKKIADHYVMTSALCAKRYVPAGKTVTPEMVEEIQIPVAYLSPGALRKKSELEDSKGVARYKARIGLVKGDALAKPKLLETSTLLGLAWVLQPGETAVTMKLSLEGGVGGLVQPGDWVDVLASIDGRTRVVLPRVRVAAVGDRVWDPSAFIASNENSKSVATDPILITLVLTPRQASVAALAADKGKITLALLSPLEPGGPESGG